MKNKYVKRSRISESKFRQLLKHFALDLDAQQISVLCKLNRNTVNRYLYLIRIRIAEFCEHESPFQGEVEVNESYFRGHRIKGKRGRGATGKPVFYALDLFAQFLPPQDYNLNQQFLSLFIGFF